MSYCFNDTNNMTFLAHPLLKSWTITDLVLKKLSLEGTVGALGYNSMKFWYFPNLSKFPKILSRLATREVTRTYHLCY